MLTAALILTARAADASRISADSFGPGSGFESFEIFDPGPNISRAGQNLLLPGVDGPYRLPSGVTIVSPVPNPYTRLGGYAIHFFRHGLDPAGGIAQMGIGANGTIDHQVKVPYGSGFLANNLPDSLVRWYPLVLDFDQDVHRVGAYVTGSSGDITISAFDASGNLIEEASTAAVTAYLWRQNFLGIESTEGIRKIWITGNNLVMDGLRFDPSYPVTVPEPSAATLWAASGLAGLAALRFRRRRKARDR